MKQPTSNRGDEVGELLPMSDLLVNACEVRDFSSFLHDTA